MEARKGPLLGRVAVRLGVMVAAALGTLALFMVLPLLQAIGAATRSDLQLTELAAVNLPPPPPPAPEEEEPPEPEPEEKPPELVEDLQPLNLDQLELALNPGFSEGWMDGGFAAQISNPLDDRFVTDSLNDLSNLAQQPRAIYRANVNTSKKMKKAGAGSVEVGFIVDVRGRVQKPFIIKSSNPLFDRACLAAIKKWKFEPAKRNGKPTAAPAKQTFTFQS